MVRSLLLIFIGLVAAIYCESIKLNVGQFSVVPIKQDTYQEFEVYIRGKHRGVYLQVSPYGCDGPVELFASGKPNPTEEQHEWRSKGERVGNPTITFIDEKEHGDAPLYFQIRTKKGATCLAHVVAHIRHFQNLLQLSQGIPAYSTFRGPTDQIQFVEFKMSKEEKDVALDLAFLVTNVNGYTASYSAYASTTNSRPTEYKHTWAGSSTGSGHSIINISHEDAKFVPGTYWIGIQRNSSAEDAYFSVVAHTITKNGTEIVDVPVLLHDTIVQTGISLPNRYTHFTFYSEKAARVVVRKSSGDVKLYASTQPAPTKENYEYEGKQVEDVYVELSVEANKKFLYVGVLGTSGSASTFDIGYITE
ncbi:hypothetical protein AKO1_012964 [Acrasis kona]|uniref:Uncharacterized protein n=1 Tax=Acrasis kona TaxID=1008807 RepID=A0AAW2YZV8_9EUKA